MLRLQIFILVIWIRLASFQETNIIQEDQLDEEITKIEYTVSTKQTKII